MNDFNSAREKKEAEKEILSFFLEMYERVTGQSITVVKINERPDFICDRKDGSMVGVELVEIRRNHPNDILWDKLVEKQDFMSIDNALKMLQEVAINKDKKRKEPDWTHKAATILLIALTDIPLAEIRKRITSENLPDLYETGFVEVRLADFTGLEAYDDLELFCVQPVQWAGYYPRILYKPYG